MMVYVMVVMVTKDGTKKTANQKMESLFKALNQR